MNSKGNGLDEMQRARRNSVGNQMFLLMFYALLFNCGLHGAGITWLPYPANVMVIIAACMGVYLIKLVALNAYLPTKALNRNGVIGVVMITVFSIVLAISVVLLLMRSSVGVAGDTADNSAVILVIISAVGLLGTAITAAIKRANNKNDRDD